MCCVPLWKRQPSHWEQRVLDRFRRRGVDERHQLAAAVTHLARRLQTLLEIAAREVGVVVGAAVEVHAAAEAGERIERAVDKAYAGGIKPMEFGGSNGTADITKAVLAAL